MYIADQEDLIDFVKRASSSSVLAIDTEFLREKTYYAKLCLIQIATVDEVALIDPFAVDDLHALAPLLENENIVKLFHAGCQDLEILYRTVGCLPKPIFDTQVAAALLGHTQQVGYAALVHSELGVSLKKADSYTDWSKRPLSDSQLSYAADDVLYLPRLYSTMHQKLLDQGRLTWLTPDFDELVDPKRYHIDVYERFRKLKRASSLNRKQLSAAREVTAWRELEAQRRDIPRKWILSDEQIVEACKREPASLDDLFMIRGIKEHLSTKDARAVLAALGKGLRVSPEDYPNLNGYSKSEPNVDALVDVMMALLKLRAKENNVAWQTLANTNDLVAVARGHFEDIDVLKGWRYTLVGKELLKLLQGEIALVIQNGEVVVLSRGDC